MASRPGRLRQQKQQQQKQQQQQQAVFRLYTMVEHYNSSVNNRTADRSDAGAPGAIAGRANPTVPFPLTEKPADLWGLGESELHFSCTPASWPSPVMLPTKTPPPTPAFGFGGDQQQGVLKDENVALSPPTQGKDQGPELHGDTDGGTTGALVSSAQRRQAGGGGSRQFTVTARGVEEKVREYLAGQGCLVFHYSSGVGGSGGSSNNCPSLQIEKPVVWTGAKCTPEQKSAGMLHARNIVSHEHVSSTRLDALGDAATAVHSTNDFDELWRLLMDRPAAGDVAVGGILR